MFEMNPWWESGGVPSTFLPPSKRTLFSELERSLDQRYIDILVGLRRTGKTTLMFQLIDHLLRRGTDPREILYFTFDEHWREIRDIIQEYEARVLREKLRERRVYLFFDEIHRLPDWPDKLKILYDLNPKAKIIVSGSASLNLMRGARESLAGRCIFHRLDPLSFREFLLLRGEKIPLPEDFEIFESRLAISFQEFLTRGFPEVVGAGDREAERYTKELVLERILYRDIPQCFPVDDVGLLRLLFEQISLNPGTILNVDSLSKSLGRARRTIGNYLNFLELTFLIRRLSNVRGSMLASSRKNKKGYPYHPCLCLGKEESKKVETLVIAELDARLYWRVGNFEVDLVLKDGPVLPLEIKYKEQIEEHDLKGMRAFMDRFGASRGIVVTKREIARRGEIEILPVLWLSLYKEGLIQGTNTL